MLEKKNTDEWVILYRGDTRPPQIIFEKGFQARNLDSEIKFGQMHFTGRHLEDINSHDAVCFTTRFDVAPMFPLHCMSQKINDYPLLPQTYIYAVRVKKNDVFMTYEHQLNINSTLAFAQEIAIKQVIPQNVVYAILADRFFNMSSYFIQNWSNGGFYNLDQNKLELNQNMASMHIPILTACMRLIDAREHKVIAFPIDKLAKRTLWTLDEQIQPKTTISQADLLQYRTLTFVFNTIWEARFAYFDSAQALLSLAQLSLTQADLEKKFPYADLSDNKFKLISLDELLKKIKQTHRYELRLIKFIERYMATIRLESQMPLVLKKQTPTIPVKPQTRNKTSPAIIFPAAAVPKSREYISSPELKNHLKQYHSTSFLSRCCFFSPIRSVSIRKLTALAHSKVSITREDIHGALRADSTRRLNLFHEKGHQNGTSSDQVIESLRDFFHPINDRRF